MNQKSKRQQVHDRQRKQKLRANLTWGGIGAAVLVFIGFLVWQGVKPAAGESIPIMAESSQHIDVDSDPGQYNSDPPTSGPHYPAEAWSPHHKRSPSSPMIRPARLPGCRYYRNR